jgi:hypothetical protein
MYARPRGNSTSIKYLAQYDQSILICILINFSACNCLAGRTQSDTLWARVANPIGPTNQFSEIRQLFASFFCAASWHITASNIMPPRLRGIVPQCSSCLRASLDVGFVNALRPLRQQTRGVKVRTASWHQPPSIVVVQLKKSVKGWGREGRHVC